MQNFVISILVCVGLSLVAGNDEQESLAKRLEACSADDLDLSRRMAERVRSATDNAGAGSVMTRLMLDPIVERIRECDELYRQQWHVDPEEGESIDGLLNMANSLSPIKAADVPEVQCRLLGKYHDLADYAKVVAELDWLAHDKLAESLNKAFNLCQRA